MRAWTLQISFIALALLPARVAATSYTWDGGGGTADWSTSTNWRITGGASDPPNGNYPGKSGSGCDDEAHIPCGQKQLSVGVNLCLAWVVISADSSVIVEAGKTVENASFIGDGRLINKGKVKATFRDVDLGSSLQLEDTADAEWKSSGSGVTLRFLRSHTCDRRLHGDFDVTDSGCLNFQADVETEGTFPSGCCSFVTGYGVFTWCTGSGDMTCP